MPIDFPRRVRLTPVTAFWRGRIEHHPCATAKAAGRRFAPALALGAIYLCLGAATRLVLWLKFGTAADVPAPDLPLLMLAGLLNDAVESLYIVAPLALYLLLAPDRWYRTRPAAPCWPVDSSDPSAR